MSHFQSLQQRCDNADHAKSPSNDEGVQLQYNSQKSTLTEEQLMRIANNRRKALERKQRTMQLQQLFSASVSATPITKNKEPT